MSNLSIMYTSQRARSVIMYTYEEFYAKESYRPTVLLLLKLYFTCGASLCRAKDETNIWENPSGLTKF